jgi:hypothetical protein
MVWGSRSSEASPSHDWNPPDLGSADEVKEKIAQALPQTVWEGWLGGLRSAGLSYEFELEQSHISDKIRMVAVSVRGNGNPLVVLKRLAETTSWYVMDCTDSTWIDLDKPSLESWEEFRKFRDSVIAQRAAEQKQE